MREEGALPADGQASLAIATDDVTHFLRASREEMQEFVAPPLASLDAVWKHRGVQEQQAKSYDLQLDATCLGIEIRGGVRQSPRAVRLLRCEGCEDNKQRPQSTKTSLPRDFVFNREVGLDILEIKDVDGTRFSCLNVLDMGTCFQIV